VSVANDPPPTVAADAPAPTAPLPGAPEGSYAFAELVDGEPVAFDACVPLTVMYEPNGEPYPATNDMATAVVHLNEAMGRAIDFQAGDTTQVPTITVRWVPSSADLPGSLGPETLGRGGYSRSGRTIISGSVALAADAGLAPGFGPGSWGGTLLHELGHSVGLAHVDDIAEVMYPMAVLDREARYGPGDRTGLAHLGGPCHSRS
ncbi:MAG: hypothetical protein ACRDY6_10400, partial [Acidimicrobiia bacterium]